jgi:menaquinone-dependent protoporphyrinogen oxidase
LPGVTGELKEAELMLRVLIAYGTSEGQTGRIAEYLANVIRSHGHQAFPVDVERASAPPPDGYDAVIVGGSIHMGTHERNVVHYVRRNRAALESLPSAFFSVSLAARDNTDEAHKEVEGYVEKFIQQTGWRPLTVGLFAGALLYTQYGFFTRWIMRKIARDKGSPDTDTSRDYVYTDWHRVQAFAEQFLEAFVPEGAAGATS